MISYFLTVFISSFFCLSQLTHCTYKAWIVYTFFVVFFFSFGSVSRFLHTFNGIHIAPNHVRNTATQWPRIKIASLRGSKYHTMFSNMTNKFCNTFIWKWDFVHVRPKIMLMCITKSLFSHSQLDDVCWLFVTTTILFFYSLPLFSHCFSICSIIISWQMLAEKKIECRIEIVSLNVFFSV